MHALYIAEFRDPGLWRWQYVSTLPSFTFTQRAHGRKAILILVNLCAKIVQGHSITSSESELSYYPLFYSVSQKTAPLQLISHNMTNVHQLFLHNKKFLHWLRTSRVVSITTEATWHTWTADFCMSRLRTTGNGETIVELCQCRKTAFEHVL